ncbi:related to AIM27-member of a transmembrane complex required for efficient folding of proteins in the ER [Sporisorium scitamineum]|uniref:ER membrane protein complex subunit 3 n=1 Tax=Sporisorium scitamineum TaxID=49012 RepID=A0A127ZJJ3_9BASI|nr:related to AIM27-member of a transmembrane complex required for efficient folding of proteins in the ER [Sporisorium scitamineum]
MALEQSLFLDSAIRDWVLIPILVVMILVGVLRHNVISLLNSAPKSLAAPALREQRVLARAGALRQNYLQLPPTSFASRKAFLSEALSNGSYLQPKDKEEKEGPKNPFEPAGGMDTMMDGMKKQMVMMIPQTVIMGWINFLSGFVLLKLPFPLTVRFKVMLQRDIQTPDLDVTWVSSLSWYFLTLFGLNAVYRLVLGDDNAADGTRDMAAMSGAAAPMQAMNPAAPGQAPDFEKLHLAERDNLELVGLEDSSIRWIGDGIEDRVLALYA